MTAETNSKLEYARSVVLEAVGKAVPALNVDYKVYVKPELKGNENRVSVQLVALTKKGDAYLPYLRERLQEILNNQKAKVADGQ